MRVDSGDRTWDISFDIHLVGHARIHDHDWFLIKDSSSAAQHGSFKGYLFYREDYVKLKMLTYIVHQDAVRAVVKQFGSPGVVGKGR